MNAGVAEIEALLEQVNAYLDSLDDPQIVIKEVEVEVPPSDDFCNVAGHRVWVVLFMISAVLNVGLVVLLIYVLMKKRNTTDNTPLVSYDIDDDMDF